MILYKRTEGTTKKGNVMKYTVEYGKVNCTPWSVEGFNSENEAQDRYDELCEMVRDGCPACDTVIISDNIEVIDFYTEGEF